MDMYKTLGIMFGSIFLVVGISSTFASIFLRLSLALVGTILLGICWTTSKTSSVETKSPLPLQYEQLNQPQLPSSYQTKLEKANEMRQNSTPAETQMWELLRKKIMPAFPKHIFYVQHVQHGDHGYILDFYCPSLGLAIEVDDDSTGYNWERGSNLKTKGLEILKVGNSEVFINPAKLASSLCKIIKEKDRELSGKKTRALRYGMIEADTVKTGNAKVFFKAKSLQQEHRIA
jgi:very-short-patch-repair endonuclease